MKKQVYLNHDGAVDDLVSLFLLLQMEDVAVTGVSVIPADCYLEPAASATRKIIDRFGTYAVEVAKSNSRGRNTFPSSWRMHAFYVDALPILNERGNVETPLSHLPAHKHMIQKLREFEERTTLLFLGPLTDLARALDEAPDIEEKIEKLIWMGGTFMKKGNVEEPEHDGTAEWNAFWDPDAVDRVWKSSIPIEMVALESTKQVPLTLKTRQDWARLRRYEGIDFVGQCYAMCPPLVHMETNSTYYLWDVLTTAFSSKKNLAKTKRVKSFVHTEGPSQGRLEENSMGRPINLVYHVNEKDFYSYITSLMKRA